MAPPPWQTSPAKQLLTELYKDKLSWIHLCLPEQIYHTEPLFEQYPWKNFQSNFNRLMDKLDLEEECIAFDQAAVDHYRNKKPQPLTTVRGEPFWEGHPAQALLKDFVAKQDEDWKNKLIPRKLLPAELHGSKSDYKAFSLPTFRNHYYRDMRALRESVYWQKKRNKDGQKKHDHEDDQRLEECS